mmetsp:Transcript_41739/g.73400  ORF Transcript_41739/g.73400 Transcript_41739/m.73400 type:complete len:236 (+) Transcript_41739:93-800(+)
MPRKRAEDSEDEEEENIRKHSKKKRESQRKSDSASGSPSRGQGSHDVAGGSAGAGKLSKKEKKDAKKAKKKMKKAKKELKKVKKKMKKAKKQKKKAASSSSSSSSDDSSSEDINFLLSSDFGSTGKQLDPRNPDAKIQRALGLTCGSFSFIQRSDDAEVAKEAGYDRPRSDGKFSEDTTRDWICQRLIADKPCGMRNFVRNEKCCGCGALRPQLGNKVLKAGDLKGVKLDKHYFR